MPANLLSLAFYLPQFHAIPENDCWWGQGFTEWVHMDRAKSWYPGHVVRQPVEPLGRYNLLDSETMQAQQALASANGIDGFLIWNYWLGGGRQLLQRPAELILEQGLDVNHAFAWANHDWVDKSRGRVLVEQRYLGEKDYSDYFFRCLPHFRSDKYIKVDNKPFFFIYRPEHMPDLALFVKTWRRLAAENGLPGLFLVGDMLRQDALPPGELDAYTCAAGFWDKKKIRNLEFLKQKLGRKLGVATLPPRFDYASLLRDFIPANATEAFIPTVFTGWDTTPRHGANGVIVDGLSTESFREHLKQVQTQLLRQAGSTRLVLVKSWNEWAEGNLLEPDSVFGESLLHEYRRFVAEGRQALGRSG